MVNRGGDFILGQPLSQNIMRGKKDHMFSHSKMKVHFRAPLTHFLKSIMRDAGETYTFATESHFAPLDQLRGNMHRILCFYYAGIMRESQMQICPSSGTQDYAGSIPASSAIFCAQASMVFFFIMRRRGETNPSTVTRSRQYPKWYQHGVEFRYFGFYGF